MVLSLYTLYTQCRLYTLLGEQTRMTIIDVMALVVCVLLYTSISAETWRDRYLSRITLGCGLALVTALAI